MDMGKVAKTLTATVAGTTSATTTAWLAEYMSTRPKPFDGDRGDGRGDNGDDDDECREDPG